MAETLSRTTQQLSDVARLSTTSSATALRTATATQAAQTAVEGTVQGMDALRESISETEKRFKRLGERSQEISSAVALVNTISERTHVLSLNASMQAATAGEAGRGFAVVAQEVQRLSDSSRQATAQISQLVANIQAETNETLLTMNRLISEVVAQTAMARMAGQEMTQAGDVDVRPRRRHDVADRLLRQRAVGTRGLLRYLSGSPGRNDRDGITQGVHGQA